jgi:ketosteroid isomerase-like protein
MLDKIEIQDLISRYSDAITRRDWEAVTSAFSPEATWHVVGQPAFQFKGRDVGPGIRSLVEPSNYLVQMNTPALIEINGDEATARSTILESGEYEAGKFQPFKARFDSFGTYEDVLRKVDGRWRFASRRFTMIKMNISKAEA